MCSPELNTPSTNGCIEVATPPEFPKGIPGIWSPEHLFTASVNSCFMTTFLAIAENSGKLEESEGKYMMTEVNLKPQVTLHDESQRERALRVLDKAEAACLITNSIKSKVTMEPLITVSLYQ